MHRTTNNPPADEHDARASSTSKRTRTHPPAPSIDVPAQPAGWRPGPFDYQRLDAYNIARRTLVRGEKLCRRLPRGYAKLADQLRRALLSAHLGIAEAASRSGADRKARFRCARGEASEAAAAVEAAQLLGLTSAEQAEPLLHDLARLCAMLTRLSGPRR